MKKNLSAALGRHQRRMGLALALTIALSQSAFAQTGFVDVADDYWGASYISTAAQAGIILGYPTRDEGVFRFDPENPVSKQESLTMIYRTLQGAGLLREETDLSLQYTQMLSDGGIAGWAGPFAAYGFHYGYVLAGDFQSSRGPAPAPRQLVGQWAAKAMGYELAAAAILPYGDGASISSESFAYLDALYRNQIMTGDNKGDLNPLAGIRRVEFAAVCTRLLADAGSEALTPQAARKLEDSLILHSGIIKSVQDGGRRFLLEKSDGATWSVQLSADAGVVLNGQAASFGDLSSLENRFASVSCLMGAGSQVLIETGVRVQTGRIESISSEENYGILTLSTDSGQQVRYCYDDNTLADVAIRKGIDVSLIADGAYVLEIE